MHQRRIKDSLFYLCAFTLSFLARTEKLIASMIRDEFNDIVKFIFENCN